jgi:hypothetical protein
MFQIPTGLKKNFGAAPQKHYWASMKLSKDPCGKMDVGRVKIGS